MKWISFKETLEWLYNYLLGLLHGGRTRLLVDWSGQSDGINSHHRILGPIKVDAHKLLPSLTLEVCSRVRQCLLNDSRLDVDQAGLHEWCSDQAEVLSARQQHLV